MKHIFIIIMSSILSLNCFGQVTLSEMQSSNSSTLADNMGEFDDWIEIHNPTNSAIEIGGLILKDQIDTWVIPTGNAATLIPPGGYFLLWADDQESQGIFHTNFKLASGGEFLGLYESDGVTVIDSVTIPAMQSDYSLIKCNSIWLSNGSPTPLTVNDCSATLNERLNEHFTIITYGKQLQINMLQQSINDPQLSIYTINGEEVISKFLNQDQTIINLNLLESTMYILTISKENTLYSKKIVLN